MPVVIDGYNLFRMVQKTESFASLTDYQLCCLISAYLETIKDHGQIVFDGIGPPDREKFFHFVNLGVVYSGRSIEADDVIEEHVLASTAPKRLSVISSDRRIRAAGKKRKCIVLKSDEFWEKLIKQLSRNPKKSREPAAKRQGISKAETEQWLKDFGLK